MTPFPHLAVCVLAACLTGEARADSPNPLVGDWARTDAGCSRPELSFASGSAVIRLDADGTPVLFRYPAVTYHISEDGVMVEMGRHHPLAKTPDKFSLRFVMALGDRANLQLRNAKTLSYFRCPLEKRP